MTAWRTAMTRRRTVLGALGALALGHSRAQTAAAPTCATPVSAPAFTLPLLPTPAADSAGPGRCSVPGASAAAGLCSEQLRGRWVYLDFWASWCAPCRLSIPWMNRLQARWASAGLQVVGINLDSQHAKALQFLHKTPATFPMLWDPSGASARAYQVQAMPMSYVIDPQGRILSAHRGYSDDTAPAVAQQIEQLMRGQCMAQGRPSGQAT